VKENKNGEKKCEDIILEIWQRERQNKFLEFYKRLWLYRSLCDVGK